MKFILSIVLMAGLMSIPSNTQIERESYDGYLKILEFKNLDIGGKNIKEGIKEINAQSLLSNVENEKNIVVNIPDEYLKSSIKSELGIINQDDIYVSDMEQLVTLNPSEFVRNLTGLEYAVNLEVLNMADPWSSTYSVRDITPLQNLTLLRVLNMSKHNIVDISPLENSINLTDLNLSMNNITDVSSLKNLTNLTNLDLSYNNIVDILPIEPLNKLAQLNIECNFIDISPSAPSRIFIDDLISSGVTVDYYFQYTLRNRFGNEFTLTKGEVAKPLVEKCRLGDDGKAWGCSTSEVSLNDLIYTIDREGSLEINSRNEIVAVNEGYSTVQIRHKVLDISIKSSKIQVTNETKLNFPDSSLETALRLSEMKKPEGDIYQSDMERLISLDLSLRRISNLLGLEHAVNLIDLNIGNNYTIGYSENKISDISLLSSLTKLENLQMRNIDISDLSSLQNLTNLSYINAEKCNITSLEPLENLTNLEILKISYNFIDIAPNTQDRVFIDELIAQGNTVDFTFQNHIKDGFEDNFVVSQSDIIRPEIKLYYQDRGGSLSSGSPVAKSDLQYTIDNESTITVNKDNDLMAVGEGTTNVQIHYKNLRGGGATIEHTITVEPYVYKPKINYDEQGYISIVDNGNNVFIEDDVILEEFNDTNLEFAFSNPSWSTSDGVMKSEIISHSQSTENQFTINAVSSQKLMIKIRVSSENNYDWGRIYLNGTEVYKKSGNNTTFDTAELDLIEGENIIKFIYNKDSSGNSGEDSIIIDEIKTYVKIPMNTQKIQYRIDVGEWLTYSRPFTLNKPGGSSTKIEAQTIVQEGVYESGIAEKIVTTISPEDLAEALVEIAEVSKDSVDISTARDAVNDLQESIKKDELQDRLDAISITETIQPKSATANLDIYIKSENMLSLSLDSNMVSFDNFSGVEDVEKLNAINMTVSSSLPYTIKAYLPTEIQNSDKTETIDGSILKIKANGEPNYNTFTDLITPILLFDDQEAGNSVNHGVDLKLYSNNSHKADVYKTTIKLEVEQK